MSQASLSQLDYSSIRFSKTMTEEFADLKKAQADLTLRADGVVVWYTALMRQKQEAAAKAAAAAKMETTGEKPAEEGGEVEIRQSVSAIQYCETRADVIDGIQEWTTEASRTIAMFPIEALCRSKKDYQLRESDEGGFEENKTDQGRRE